MKNLLYMALWFMGLVGGLVIWVVNAGTTITHYTGSDISYTLNWDELFTWVWTITITNWIDTITILDRNLWATVAGIWCQGSECESWDSTYWYLFQWGNNYGFPGTWSLPHSMLDNRLVDSTLVSNNYISNIFHYSDYYGNWINDNDKVDMWWWNITDNIYDLDDNTWKVYNPAERQWPCPDGFHVPNVWELNKLIKMTWKNAQNVRNYLQIPLAGFRDHRNNPEPWWLAGLGSVFHIWSSSPVDSTDPKSRKLRQDSWGDFIEVNNGYRNFAYSIRCFYNKYNVYGISDYYSLTYDSQWWSKVNTWLAEENTPRTRPDDPTKSGYIFVDWYTSTGYDTIFDFTWTIASGDSIVYAKWWCETGYKDNWTTCVINKDIVIEATATDANQTLKINKYFANDYTVDRWDGTSDDLIDDIVHTYDEASGYTITLSLSWADRWTFLGVTKPLVPAAETTMTWIKIVTMPSLAEWFGESTTSPGNNFFRAFNHQWALVSLSTWSFDTSSIEVPWNGFFQGFNYEWMLKTLPDWSFNISNIETVGDYFFQSFNVSWALIGLPDGSFDTSNIKTVWDAFFNTFNRNGSLISLPTWSFNISNITWDVGKFFFCAFNREWELTSLPNDSFDTSNIKSAGDYFFNNFNDYWWITSLPSWSFNIFNIESVWSGFFQGFNYEWKISGIPSWAFKFSSWLNTVWNDFFYQFNQRWKIASLPDDSFNTSNIVSVWNGFFQWFNCEWLIASLPNNSFNTSNIKTVGESFFRSFNDYWALTSLPDGSFDLSWITDAGANFFRFFNGDWKLTTLPDSFTMSSVWASASYWYRNAFNSPDYTLNKNVLDLVTWITNPSNDRNTFSDNQPWRCGVHPNWLVNPANACNVKYDANGWSGTTTWWYISNATWVEVWSWITLPTREWYTLHGWQDASWNIVDEVIFPDMDGQTLYANWMPIEYEINYELNDGIISWENITWYTIESGDITLINPTKTWYTFTWRSGTELNSLTTSVTIPTWSTWDREYEANWEINQYTITFKDWDNEITSITADYWTWITPPSNPTKNGYKFTGWDPEIPATMPAENMTINAKWERNWSSGGWWGSSSKTDTGTTASGTWNQINSNTWDIASTWTNVKEPETNTGSSIQTWSQVDSSEQTTQNDESNTQDSLNNSSEWHIYTQEFQEAYEFAKWNWITTMPTIQKANMEWKLTRIAMAKMLSQYKINVLWKTPDTTQSNKFNDVTDKLDSDYDDWVTLAYQLGIMWQNMPWNNFRPNDEVTRAEFATALSRMAYWTSDWEYKATSKYYVHHMEKLVKEWIITNDDPNMKELRWYVMIMLMRSTENK